MGQLSQQMQIVPITVPFDVTGGAMTGDWVSMVNYAHCTVVYVADIGAAGQDCVLTLLQATNNAGGSSKALNFTEVYQKQGGTAISAVGQFSKISGQSDNTYVDTDGGENECQKDRDNGGGRERLWRVQFVGFLFQGTSGYHLLDSIH